MKKLLVKTVFFVFMLNACKPIPSSYSSSAITTYSTAPLSVDSIFLTKPINKTSLKELKNISKNNNNINKEVYYNNLSKINKQKTIEIVKNYFLQNINFTKAKEILNIYLCCIEEQKEKEIITKRINFLNNINENKFNEIISQKIKKHLDSEVFKSALKIYKKIENDMEKINILLYLMNIEKNIKILHINNKNKSNEFNKAVEIFEKVLFRPDLVAAVKNKPNMTKKELSNLEIDLINITNKKIKKISRIKENEIDYLLSLNLIDHNNNRINSDELVKKIIDKKYTKKQIKKFKTIINYKKLTKLMNDYFRYENNIFDIIKNLNELNAYVNFTGKEQNKFKDELGIIFANLKNQTDSLLKILSSMPEIQIKEENIIFYKSTRVFPVNSFIANYPYFLQDLYDNELSVTEISNKTRLIVEEIQTKDSFGKMSKEVQEIITKYMQTCLDYFKRK